MAPVSVNLPMFDHPSSSLVPSYGCQGEKDSSFRCCVAGLVVALSIPLFVIVLLVLKLLQFDQE